MKVLTILGTRPQYIKAAPLSRELRRRSHQEHIIDTGQHYDDTLSSQICRDLELTIPEVIHTREQDPVQQLASLLPILHDKITTHTYDWVITFGDTRSTLAAILSGIHTKVPLVHIEAGLRLQDTYILEEYYRKIADHCSDLHCCPTQTAVNNLRHEGKDNHVYLVGDLMYEQFLYTIAQTPDVLPEFGLVAEAYCVLTMHRAETLQSPGHLKRILESVLQLRKPILFPIHPHTMKQVKQFQLEYILENPLFHVVDPLPHSTLITLIDQAYLVLTDSGGVQKEAAFAGTSCIVLRHDSEWKECLQSSATVLLDDQYDRLVSIADKLNDSERTPLAFGDGKTAEKIVSLLETVKISKK